VALRRAVAADVAELATLYATTAAAFGPRCYTPAQAAAWVSFGRAGPAFEAYVLEPETWIALDAGGAALGFSGVDDGGEVRSLYVRHDAGRRGVGARLLGHVLDRAGARGLTRLAAWVTPFSLPLFERAGFVLVARQQADFQGVSFERLRVSR